MNLLHIAVQITMYVVCSYSMGLVAWVVTRRSLPSTSRVGLRLAATLAGQFAVCAIVVQSLGLLGQLTVPVFTLVSMGLGAATTWTFRSEEPNRGLWNLLRRSGRLWLHPVPAAALGIGTCLLFLADRFFGFVREIDSLTIHGPLIVDWIQTGVVPLSSQWNYPQCWEYQYVPSYLLLRSDALVFIPGTLLVATALLLTRELGSMLGLPGRVSWVVSLLFVFNPVLWGGTLKNDVMMACGVLLSVIAITRVGRNQTGALWLAQLGAFLIFGSKASGFVYVGLFLGLLAAVWIRTNRRRKLPPKSLVLPLVGSGVFLANAAAVQINNLIVHGNPTYPIRLKLGERIVFPGPGDLSGTSILESASNPKTWQTLLKGSTTQLGVDLPILALLLFAVIASAVVGMITSQPERRPRGSKSAWILGISLLTCTLWVLYLATPWTLGTRADPTQHLRHGGSLRYAIGPLAMTYLLGASFLVRRLGRRSATSMLTLIVPALVVIKWSTRRNWGEPFAFVVWKVSIAVAIVWALAWLARTVWTKLPVDRPKGRPQAGHAAAALVLLVIGLLSYVSFLESRRFERWETHHRPMWRAVREQVPPGTVIGTNSAEPLFSYFLLGERFDNEIRQVPFRSRNPRGIEDESLVYYYLFSKGSQPRQDQFLRTLVAKGWSPIETSRSGRGTLLHFEVPRP